MIDDIRDIASLTGKEVAQLNFIRDSSSCHFRKHHRQGMRSHIFEVLAVEDLEKETEGELIDGVRWYPRATPKYMLRILRTRFASLEQILDEIKRYTLVLDYLGPELIATSTEFIVEYTGTGKSDIILCGLQEYVDGAILDPWGLVDEAPMEIFYRARFPGVEESIRRSVKAVTESVAAFVGRMRKMITESGYITDLAGNGNLIMTGSGQIKLVDINNIIKVSTDETISLDDKAYPSCDKSIEVLAILDEKVLGTKNISSDLLYKRFLSASRKKRVSRLEKQFFENLSLRTSV